jgi:hypothetical protein
MPNCPADMVAALTLFVMGHSEGPDALWFKETWGHQIELIYRDHPELLSRREAVGTTGNATVPPTEEAALALVAVSQAGGQRIDTNDANHK